MGKKFRSCSCPNWRSNSSISFKILSILPACQQRWSFVVTKSTQKISRDAGFVTNWWCHGTLKRWQDCWQCCLPYLSAWNPNGSPLVPTSTPSHGFDPWNKSNKGPESDGSRRPCVSASSRRNSDIFSCGFSWVERCRSMTWFILQQADIIDISRSDDYPCQSFLGAWFQHESACRPYLRPALDEVFLTISKHSGSLEELHSQKFHDPFMGCWERLTHDRWYFGCKLSSERWPNLPPM